MANPTRSDDEETEAIRQAGITPDDGNQSTRPEGWPGIPAPDEPMRRSAESGEGEIPEADLPSNRAQERGGP